MPMLRPTILAATMMTTVLAYAPASAATVGSATVATTRSCAAVNAATWCDGFGPGQNPPTAIIYGGGMGVGGATVLSPSPGNYASADVEFGFLDLPEIRAETRSDANTRVTISSYGFKSLRYTGAEASDFSLTGALHIVDSSNNPVAGELPGGAIFTAYVAIWDPSIVAGLQTPEELFTRLFYAPCGTPGVLGVANWGGNLPGGEFSTLGTTSACSPGSLTLNPGQDVLAVTGMQLPVNRGGWANSTSTFITRLGDDLSTEQRSFLASSLVSGRSLVPEPGSWAMLIAGFGLVGAMSRRQRQAMLPAVAG